MQRVSLGIQRHACRLEQQGSKPLSLVADRQQRQRVTELDPLPSQVGVPTRGLFSDDLGDEEIVIRPAIRVGSI